MQETGIVIPPRVRFVMGAEHVFRHWLLIWLVLFTIYNVLPYLAPLLMQAGLEPPARLIYSLYGFVGHQMAHRSFFFFGEQLTYTPEELPLTLVGEFLPDSTALRDFIGNDIFGWKVAWSDRLVSMYGSALITSYLYTILRKRPAFKSLSRTWMILLITPLILDGVTHYISDFGSVIEGFRWDNAWFANLTFHVLPDSFYIGDRWGSFNSILRLITGILFGIGLMGWGLPVCETYFKRNARILQERLETWRARQLNQSDTSNSG